MSITNTTTIEAPTNTKDVSHVPFLNEQLTVLFERDELFAGIDPANAWFKEFGDVVLKALAKDVVSNLLSASSTERRTRGILVLERAILAQAAWLQLFPLMAPAGRNDPLKSLTSDIRNADTTVGDHIAAKAAALAAFVEFTERQLKLDSVIPQIQAYLADLEFMAFISNALIDARTDARDPKWMMKMLEAVQKGAANRQHPNGLEALAKRLDTLKLRQQWVNQIAALAEEEVFIYAARNEGIRAGSGRPMGMFDWQLDCLDVVLAGEGANLPQHQLQKTAERLATLSSIFFDEGTPVPAGTQKKGGNSSKARAKERGRSEAERRSADSNRQRNYPQAGQVGKKK
ncbi:MAG: hypothetical protein WCI47_00855 [bacterium]